MAVTNPQTILASDTFDPVDPTPLPAGYVITDEISTTRQSYNSAAVTYWNAANRFNKQGQKWAAVDGGNASAGVQNRSTPRGIFGAYAHHVTQVETVITGNKFDIQIRGTADSAWDCTVWIEVGGRMRRLSQFPKGFASGAGLRYRNIALDPSIPFSGRVRVHTAASVFVGFGHEAHTILRAAPNRPYYISDGDSYWDGQQAQNAGSGDGYFSMGLGDHMFEFTGWVDGRRAQGGTALFQNGGGTKITNDTATFMNTTRAFSANRKAWMTNLGPAPFDFSLPLGERPWAYVFNGTWNEPASDVTEAEMYARAKACYEWVHSMDEWITMFHVTCEPYWGDAAGGFGAVGALTGPPDASSPRYQLVLGQIRAAADVPRTKIINPYGIVGGAEPWWTGKGHTATKSTTDVGSQQAQLTGDDFIHGNYRGYQHYARRIAAEIGATRLPLARVRGNV